MLPPLEVRQTHPIASLPGKRGRFVSGRAVRAAGSGLEWRESESRFYPLAYHAESDTTLLLARAVTGRTHQLRVHLQALGHCIANDPQYGAAEGEALHATWLRHASDPSGWVPSGQHPDAAAALLAAVRDDPLAGCTVPPDAFAGLGRAGDAPALTAAAVVRPLP